MRYLYFSIPATNLYKACLFAITLLTLSSCDKFEGSQTVPSYLQIDSINFESDHDIQGTNVQKFTDAWVYVDDDLIGGFEMPATIPVLAEGVHKLEIRPGIFLNGISDTRAPYPCIQPDIIYEFNFVKDSISKVSVSSTYYGNAEFVWMEAFEDASLAIKKSPNSDTGIVRTQPIDNPDAFLKDNSHYSGISYIDSERKYLELVSDNGAGEGFVFDRGDFIFLEINYKTTATVVVGVYITMTDNTVQDRPFVAINPSDHWNKIYVNFTPIVNETNGAVNYKIYFSALHNLGSGSDYVMLDNIKLVTRPNL